MSKISSKEIFTFSFCLATFLFPGFGNDIILEYTKSSSFFASFLGFIIGFIPVLMLIFMSKKLKNQSIFEFNKEKFKVFGSIMNFILVLCVILIYFISSWILVNFVISQFLTRNSYFFLAIIMFGIIALAVIKGKEVMGRSNLILLMVFFATMIFCFVLLVPQVEIENLKPFFYAKPIDFVESSLTYFLLSAVPMLLILAIKRSDIVDLKKYNKNVVLSYVLAGVLLVGFMFLVLGIFGIDVAYVLAYPEYTVFKKINLFGFVERVENIIAVMFFISFYGGFAFMLLFVKEWFKNTFKVKNEKNPNIFIFIVALVIPILAILFFKRVHNHLIYMNFPYILVVLFFIFLIVFIYMVGSFLYKKIIKKC